MIFDVTTRSGERAVTVSAANADQAAAMAMLAWAALKVSVAEDIHVVPVLEVVE